MYVKEEYNNSNYKYYFNNDNILIVTNKNCYQNYNSQFCDCYLYNYKERLGSKARECNVNQNLYEIDYSNIKNRDIFNIYNIAIVIIALLFVIMIKELLVWK